MPMVNNMFNKHHFFSFQKGALEIHLYDYSRKYETLLNVALFVVVLSVHTYRICCEMSVIVRFLPSVLFVRVCLSNPAIPF